MNATVVPLLALSLAWRRQRSLEVLAIVLGGGACLALAHGASQTWSSVFIGLVAIYSAAAHSTRPWLTLPVAGFALLVRDANDPLIHGFGDAIWSSTLLGLGFAAGMTGRALRRRDLLLDERASALETEAAGRAALAVQAERRRIARELHDIISHSLGVVVLQAGAAERVLDRDPEKARGVLASIADTGREAIAEMGTLLGLLDVAPSSSREPAPSLDAIASLVRRAREAGAVVGLEVTGRRRPLPPALEVSAYRVAQEGLTNALRHAHGAAVCIRLGYQEDRLDVVVTDAGRAGEPAPAGGRRGLVGLHERVTLFGGLLETGPGLDGGWQLRASFPLAAV